MVAENTMGCTMGLFSVNTNHLTDFLPRLQLVLLWQNIGAVRTYQIRLLYFILF